MDFLYYIGFFHDGGLDRLKHEEDQITFHLNSAELLPEGNRDGIKLDDHNCIRGDLIVKGIKGIKINDKNFKGVLSITHDDGEVLDFDIKDHKLELGIEWRDFPPKPRCWDYSMIEIEADQILWQDAFNDVTIDLTGLWTGTPPASTD